jgi:hypothetical protein
LGDSGLIDNGTAIYTTTRNVGFGTATPGAILHTLGTGTTTGIFATTSANAWVELRRSTSTTLGYIGTGAGLVTGGAAADLAFRCESGNLLFSTGATERARIDSLGRWYVGVAAVSPGSSGIWAIINQPGGAGGQEWHNSTGSQGGTAVVPSQDRATWYVYSGSVGSEIYKQSCAFTPTGIDLTGAWATPGIKLPNAPGNTDPNTLDSYREGTRVLAAGDLSGWTYVTATQYWTLVGRTVTLHTIFTGGTSSATGGATIATPPLLTPLRIAAGAAVNSAGTALGNGVCVVASTSSTTGTVTTSSAISSSALDKVITVTYETAGL